ncbi:MAG TPA: translocation/assembly module TamB domain-containing protein, partial [Gemmatimonadaceae bacterium]|nr:translocation/assembly module TamB domain-containing protein [Gemmatimonadaceae bacterium]
MSDETTPTTTDAERSKSERLRWGRGMLVLLSIVLGTVALGAGAVYVVSSTEYGHERVRRFALKQIQSKAHGVVRIGRVSGNLLHGLTLHDVAITDSAGAPFFAADSVRAGYSLRPFLSKHVVLRDVVLSRPVIVLDRPPGGEWNYARIFPGDTTTKQDTTPGWGSWLRFENVRVAQGRVIVRTPWHPDTTLAQAKQDSVVRVALAGGSRMEVVRAPSGGFQKVSDFRDIDGRFPLIRLADPSTKVRRIEVATANLIALPFRPPAADVRDVSGAFELTSDSLWFSGVRAAFPASKLVDGAGSYVYESGDLRLEARGAPASFGDFRWAYPRFPSAGGGTLDYAMALLGEDYDFVIRNSDVAVGQSHLSGDLGFRITKAVTFHDTNLRFQRFDTRLLEQLVQNLKLPRNGLATGRLAMAGGFDSLNVNGDIAFADPSYGTSRLVALGMFGYDTVPGGKVLLRARDLRLRVAPFQVATARVFAPSLPVAGTLVGTATLDGSTGSRLVAVTDLTHDDRGAHSRVSGRTELRFTHAGAAPTWADANLRLSPLSLAEMGRFAPAAGLRGRAAGPVRVTGSLASLRVDAPLGLSNGGREGFLAVRGTLDLASAQKGYDLTAVSRLFDAHAIVAKAPSTSLTMTATARGRGFDPATMRAAFAADVQTSSYDSIPVDSARLRVRMADGMLTADSTTVFGSAARAVVSGSFGLAAGRQGTLAYTVEADSLGAFSRLLPKGDTTAVPQRPRRAARALARARADSAQVAEREAVASAATGRVPRSRRERLTVDTAAVRGDSLAGSLYAAGVIRGGLQRFDLRGRAGVDSIVAFGSTVRRGRIEYGWTGAMTPASAFAVGAQLDSATVGGFALDSVDARATYRKPGGSLAVVVKQEENRAYSVVADYAFHPDHNELHWTDVTMRLDTTRWVATRPGGVRWGPKGVEIETLELRNGPAGRIYVNGLLPTEGEGDLQVAVDNFQVGDVIALAESDVEANGRLSLGLNFSGTLRRPRFRGAIGVVDADYRGAELPDVKATFAYERRRLDAKATLLRGTGAPMAVAEGSVPVNLAMASVTGPRLRQNSSITLDVTADSLPLELLPQVTDAVADVRGLAQGVVKVRGTVHDPKLAGALALTSGQIRVVPAGITLRQVAGSVRMAGDTIVVDSIVGYSGG